MASFNGTKGATVFGIAGFAIQLSIHILDRPVAKRFFSHQTRLDRLLIVSALTFAVTPLGLVSAAGISLSAALIHTSTLTAFMVFLNQIHLSLKRPPRGIEIPRRKGGKF
jgi:hypothetical protein